MRCLGDARSGGDEVLAPESSAGWSSDLCNKLIVYYLAE